MTTDLMRYASMLAGEGRTAGLPPVECWDPPYCGELDLVIRRDGLWIHEGAPIGRAQLVRLFSTILKKEGERYFLVTPAEKLGIEVEDAPFVAVLMREEESPEGRRLAFTTNVGDEITAGPGHAIDFHETAVKDDWAPYIHVRSDLWALVARAVYYDLVALGETRQIGSEAQFGVASGGAFYPFGPAAAVLGERRS